jgi:hypothetical protein
MRIYLFFSVLFFSPAAYASVDPIQASPTVTDVTVYRSGARVKCKVTVDVPAGISNVVLDHCAGSFRAGSLQVHTTGSVDLLSAGFRYKAPEARPFDPAIFRLQDSIQIVKDQIEAIEGKQAILNGEIKIIEDNSRRIGTTLTGQSTTLSVTEIRELSDYYRKALYGIQDEKHLLVLEIREKAALLKGLNERLQKRTPGYGKRPPKWCSDLNPKLPGALKSSVVTWLQKRAGSRYTTFVRKAPTSPCT